MRSDLPVLENLQVQGPRPLRPSLLAPSKPPAPATLPKLIPRTEIMRQIFKMVLLWAEEYRSLQIFVWWKGTRAMRYLSDEIFVWWDICLMKRDLGDEICWQLPPGHSSTDTPGDADQQSLNYTWQCLLKASIFAAMSQTNGFWIWIFWDLMVGLKWPPDTSAVTRIPSWKSSLSSEASEDTNTRPQIIHLNLGLHTGKILQIKSSWNWNIDPLEV